MKILAGSLKGRNFYMPQHIRPTQNVVRKAIFDILGDIEGLAFLELFAGSGSVGFEALSRGAKRVVFVENDHHCVEVIEDNIQLLDPLSKQLNLGELQLLAIDTFAAIRQLERIKSKFDLVFLDPPFEAQLGKKALKTLGAHDILHPNCLVVVQVGKREILSSTEDRFLLVKQKNYGASQLYIYSYGTEGHLSG